MTQMKILCPKCTMAWMTFRKYDFDKLIDKFTGRKETYTQCYWVCSNPCCKFDFDTGKPYKGALIW